jgi:hypothetical protein
MFGKGGCVPPATKKINDLAPFYAAFSRTSGRPKIPFFINVVKARAVPSAFVPATRVQHEPANACTLRSRCISDRRHTPAALGTSAHPPATTSSSKTGSPAHESSGACVNGRPHGRFGRSYPAIPARRVPESAEGYRSQVFALAMLARLTAKAPRGPRRFPPIPSARINN